MAEGESKVRDMVAELEASLLEAKASVQQNYDGPDPSVKCSWPPCTNRLRRSDYGGAQWCSKEHRTLSTERAGGGPC